MGIQIGNSEVTNIQVGNTPVTAVYAGSTLVWPVGSQWAIVYEGNGNWFHITDLDGTSSSYTYYNKDVNYENRLPIIEVKPGKKYKITISGIDRKYGGSYKTSFGYQDADSVTPFELESDDNQEIKINSTFSDSNLSNEVYNLFHVIDNKLVCTAYCAANEKSGFTPGSKANTVYGVPIKVTKIEVGQ